MTLGFSKLADDASAGVDALGGAPDVDDLNRQFARELHDQVAEPLVSLLFQVREIRAGLQAGPPSPEDLAALEDSVRSVLKRTRQLITDRREGGRQLHVFAQALEDDLPVPPGRQLRIQVAPGWPREIDRWVGFNLLRIVQQAVSNAWRHGQARTVDVVVGLGLSGDAVITVLDDGIGIADSPSGYGMAGMRERALIVGGTVRHEPGSTGGTRVEVRIPVEELH